MQLIFLNINPSVQLPAIYYEDGWLFQLPSGVEVDLIHALQFLATKRRYPTRTLPTIRNVRTHYMVDGELKAIPWSRYLSIMEEIDHQLLNMYECFCCCNTFASVVDLKDVTNDWILVKSPCGNADHHCCTDCLRTILLNFYSHPVTKASPTLNCFFPDCGDPSTYELSDMKPLFTDDEFQQLRAHVEKMQVPDTLSVQCYHCEEMIVTPMKDAYKNRQCIHLGCCQPTCNAIEAPSTCWNCMNKASHCLCRLLPDLSLEKYSGSFNRYYRPLQRNFQLTRETCLRNLKHIIRHPRLPLAMQCPKCNAYIQKSGECNEMSHCGIKWCYCCGRQTLPNETLLFDHFGKCCPRYESRKYWQDRGATQYRCIEHLCYDETRECSCERHKPGIEEKNIVHRACWLAQFLESTPPKLAEWLVRWLLENKKYNIVVRKVL